MTNDMLPFSKKRPTCFLKTSVNFSFSQAKWLLRIVVLSWLTAAVTSVLWAQTMQAQTAKLPTAEDPQALTRKYREHESISYRMLGINQGKRDTIRYEAQVAGEVKRDSAGILYEDLHWTSLSLNGARFPLTPASTGFHQLLSLSPAFSLSVPKLSAVQPELIGPIVDLLNFYVDLQLTMRQSQLHREGDHAYVKHSLPNSWADGVHVLVGEDAIDFDIVLGPVSVSDQSLSVVVRHVPPQKPGIKLAADWMQSPVSDCPNNWVKVTKTQGGQYVAAVGKETFAVTIKVNRPTGAIISASMDNPVEVLERECPDSTLANPGNPIRYTIHRRIELY